MALLVAGALWCAFAPRVYAIPRVTVAVLPEGTTLRQLGEFRGMAVGIMSTGIGRVPAEQTYLDISQGSRLADSLYDGKLPSIAVNGPMAGEWRRILDRADSAPADIEPGLLGTALSEGDVGSRANPFVVTPAVIAADRNGLVTRGSPGPGVTVEQRQLPQKHVYRFPPGDLLIAFAAPNGDEKTVPIGIAGGGFAGMLTSDSTRTDGYVLSTDIAPTILERFGLDVPDAIDGEPIRSEGTVDVAAVNDLADRMAAIPDRREPILVASILAWLLLAFAVNRTVIGLRRVAMAWLALCFAYMPLTLLAGAWLEPGAIVEGLLVGLGSALLAALTARVVPGWRGLAIACAITVIAYAIDVIAGSGLTRLSLLGPNPLFGARFYGIGNELEALFAVMVPVGVGAGLSAWRGAGKALNERGAGLAFLVAGLIGALAFGAGRFGADVGAAIVLPIGAIVAAWVVLIEASPTFGPIGTTKRQSLAAATIVAAPLLVLALLVFIDLVSGANAHLTRSVINAGGASNLSETVQRRLELSANDFEQAAGNPLFWVVVVGLVVAISRWRRIDAWLRMYPLARAGLIGACAAVAVGVLVNDSGATFLVLGTLALGAFLAYAWSQAGEIRSSPRNASVSDG